MRFLRVSYLDEDLRIRLNHLDYPDELPLGKDETQFLDRIEKKKEFSVLD
jgi:hypothetical protein